MALFLTSFALIFLTSHVKEAEDRKPKNKGTQNCRLIERTLPSCSAEESEEHHQASERNC